jgi:hypothetical protein
MVMENNDLKTISSALILWKSLWHSKSQFITIIIAIIIALYFVLCTNSSTFYNNKIDPFLSILTFVIAIIIGVINLRQNWINSLEKRLTVFFVYYYESKEALVKTLKFKDVKQVDIDNQLSFIDTHKLKEKTPYCLIVCEEALLAHEGDIRNWGQQLGSQYEALGRLSFHPFFTLGKNKSLAIRTIDNKKITTKQYFLFIFLDKIPITIIQKGQGSLSTDNYDDNPTNKNHNFIIREIDYKNLLEYQKAKIYIKDLELLTEAIK